MLERINAFDDELIHIRINDYFFFHYFVTIIAEHDIIIIKMNIKDRLFDDLCLQYNFNLLVH